ncbi:MAG: hypothetical protein L3J92_03550 [Thermoplasmata archaeon]|jgi:hypothetical protein|nr:hypothetical protein [Thermoplasmata archaeon]
MALAPPNDEPIYEYGTNPPGVNPATPEAATIPSAPPPAPTAPSPPKSRRNVWIAVAAIAVVAVVVIAIFVLMIGSNSGGSNPNFGTPAPYSQAIVTGTSGALSASGGPWTIVAAEGLGLSGGITSPNLDSIGQSGCDYTPSPGAPTTVSFPGTPSNASAGELSTWIFFAKNTAASAILLIEVSDGSATPLVTATGASCITTFTSLGAINATGVLDSPAIASELNQGGGATFLQNHTGATEVFILLGGDSATSGNPTWTLLYSTCAFTATSGSGTEITANYYAVTGTGLSGPTTQAQSC